MMRRIINRLFPKTAPVEPLMYRVHLFHELIDMAGKEAFAGKRILEIGPKDGLDSLKLAELGPSELCMVELPEKKDQFIAKWIDKIACPHKIIYENILYLPHDKFVMLGKFNLIWCTGVLYHNAEQLRFLRKLFNFLEDDGYLVLESATLRLSKKLRQGNYVEIFYPQTYRNTGTITHLPSAGAIKCWLQMVGFSHIFDSNCYRKDNKDLLGQRYSCICQKTANSTAGKYYNNSQLNPGYCFGEST